MKPFPSAEFGLSPPIVLSPTKGLSNVPVVPDAVAAQNPRFDRKLLVSLLIVGCGYVGLRVARLCVEQGQSVWALTRGGDKSELLQSHGVKPVVADWLDSQLDWRLPSIETALVAVPHRPEERYGEQTHCVGLANLIERLPALSRLVVLSTTGVYHQSDGEEVDERSPTRPERIGPQIALAAEQWLQQHLPNGLATSLRLAGIYGVDRVPLLAKLKEQQPLAVADGMLNLIHVVDIARAICQLLVKPIIQPLYVLSDGHPVERRTFYSDAARIFGTSPPMFTVPDPDSVRSGRGESQKRVNPRLILDDLDFQLAYPDHVAGLQAVLAGEDILAKTSR